MKYILFLIPLLVGVTPVFAELNLTDTWIDANGIKHVEYEYDCRTSHGMIHLNYFEKVNFKYIEMVDGDERSFQRDFTVQEIINDIMPYYQKLLDKPASDC